MECGVDLRTVQKFLGHARLETTAIYTHTTDKTVDRLHRALDELLDEL